MQLPGKDYCLFINTGEIRKVISMRWSYCNDVCVFILKGRFPHMSKASIRLISANVFCASLDDYKVITAQMTYLTTG